MEMTSSVADVFYTLIQGRVLSGRNIDREALKNYCPSFATHETNYENKFMHKNFEPFWT